MLFNLILRSEIKIESQTSDSNATVAVIVIAIAVICVLRGRNEPPPGFPKGTV